MSRRAALNLLLLGAVAVLAALVFLQPGIETPPPVPTLTDRAPDSVARLRIERSGQTAVLLEKREGRWLMVEPLSLPANGFRIQTLLEVLGAATERSYRVQDLELARFGLEPPQASLVLDDLRLDFGDTESLSGRRYLRVGDRVHLVTIGGTSTALPPVEDAVSLTANRNARSVVVATADGRLYVRNGIGWREAAQGVSDPGYSG